MAYTRHGHHISGTSTVIKGVPPENIQCGGPKLCRTCQFDAKNFSKKSTEHPVKR